jgi:hypothetical protein
MSAEQSEVAKFRRRVKVRLNTDPNKKKVISSLSESDRLKRFMLISAVNFTFFFILAYVITYMLNRFSSGIVAILEEKGPFMNYNYLLFWAEYKSWDQKSIISIFATGIGINLVLGLASLVMFLRTRKREGYFSIFLLWLFYFSCVRVFGGIYAGIITHRDFGFLTMWLYLTKNQEVALMVISALVLVTIGSLTTKWFLQTTMSNSLIQGNNRANYILICGLIPSGVGSVVIMISHLPVKQIHELILLLGFPLLFMPMFLLLQRMKAQNIVSFHKPSNYALQTKFILYTTIILVGFRLILGKGITL